MTMIPLISIPVALLVISLIALIFGYKKYCRKKDMWHMAFYVFLVMMPSVLVASVSIVWIAASINAHAGIIVGGLIATALTAAYKWVACEFSTKDHV